MTNKVNISIMVFAYNNEDTIQDCLESIIAGGVEESENIHVIINGSSDRTEEIVELTSSKYNNIKPLILKLGDRANAWNYYIYKLGSPDDHHIFIDGDVTISKNSLTKLKQVIKNNPKPMAYSTLPKNGRLKNHWTKMIVDKHAMFGNFYCLSSDTFKLIRSLSFRLPVGLLCDDAFITWAILRELKQRVKEDGTQIFPVNNIGFYYDSFSLYKPSGIYSHLKRLQKYAKRDIQNKLLTDNIMKHGYESIPTHIAKLYSCPQIIKCIPTRISLLTAFFPSAAYVLCKSRNSHTINSDDISEDINTSNKEKH